MRNRFATRLFGNLLTVFAARARHTQTDGTVYPQHRRKAMLLLLAILLVAGGRWLLTSTTQHTPPESTTPLPPWQTCLPQESMGFSVPKDQPPLVLLAIPAGTYEPPSKTSGLFPFLHPHNTGPIVIENSFFIQEQKMTRFLFTQYVQFVESLPPGEEKEARQSHIGMLWNREETQTTIVHNLSWEAATDFSGWLSQKTGCSYSIPSREEWVAAIIHLYTTGEPVPKTSSSGVATPMDHLLRSGQEWTRSPCAVGYHLVGEEDWGTGPESGQAVCMPALFSVAGFRVVLKNF